MKKTIFILSLIINLILVGYIFLNHRMYSSNYFGFTNHVVYSHNEPDTVLLNKNKVMFSGNSITANWMHLRPHFFISNNYVCKAIGGQTSSQLLLHFRQDLIDVNPEVVIINIGINDIAEGDGFYNADFTLNNIKSMAEIAKANNVKVVLSSVLPAQEYGRPWNKIKDMPDKIDSLNTNLLRYAEANNIPFIDYNSMMRNELGGMKSEYTIDGIHPNDKGYEIMESIIH